MAAIVMAIVFCGYLITQVANRGNKPSETEDINPKKPDGGARDSASIEIPSDNTATAEKMKNQGLQSYKDKNFSDAIKCFEEYRKYGTRDETVDSILADSYYQLKNYEQAKKVLEELLTYSSNPNEVLAKLGFVYVATKEYNRSIESFEKALEGNSMMKDRVSEIRYYLGYAYMMTGEAQRAIELFEEFLNNSNGNVEMRNRASQYLHELRSSNKPIGDNSPTSTISKPTEKLLGARPSYIKGRQEYDRGNYSMAASYWEQAAKQDYAMAQYCLVFLYLWKDRSGLRSLEKAEYWALKAVNHNDSEFDSDTCKTEIMFSLGFIYAKRNDCREAQKWYLDAADRGDSKAQLNLGLLELKGCDWPNPVKAENWFFLSARQGEKNALEALFQLGMRYYEGDTEGIPKDCRAAIRCWEKARGLGSWKARTTLERPDLRNCE
jgi:TPR repeat protein